MTTPHVLSTASHEGGDMGVAAAGRPALCDDGHVLVVTSYYPPAPVASSVVVYNLLSAFDPSSYSVVTARPALAGAGYEAAAEGRVHVITPYVRSATGRVNQWYQELRHPLSVRRLVRQIRATRARVVVGVYPDLYFLQIARDAARAAGVPLVVYLHDTVAEAHAHRRTAARAARVQAQVFREAAAVCVMSRGMAELYERKFGLACEAVEHTYPEAIPATPPAEPPLRQALWAGAIYDINRAALARVSDALGEVGCPLLVTGKLAPPQLEALGVRGPHVTTDFLPSRAAYLALLRRQGLLVLALSAPDEASTHEDELATIFPTKTPEYLAAGRPLLVHCPERYYLARFVREHGCGLVVPERSTEALAAACRFLLSEAPAVREMRRRALEAARFFSREAVAARFRQIVQRASASG